MVALVLLVGAAAGCRSSDGWKFASWNPVRALKGEPEPPDPQIPQRLVTSWSNATLTTPGQPPQRGFGGRIVFFGPESEDPVRVDGQFVVYAFDETDRPSYETKPTRRYVFPAEEFARHESSSAWGRSYSVWLPWDEQGGPQKKISLIARFEPKKGSTIVGEQTRHFLPGVASDLESPPQLAGGGAIAADAATRPAAAAPASPGIELASYQAPIPPTGSPKGGQTAGASSPLETTAIRLPKRLATQIHQSASRASLPSPAPLPATAAGGATTATMGATATTATGSATPSATDATRSRTQLAAATPIMGQPLRAQPLAGFPPSTLPAPASPVGR